MKIIKSKKKLLLCTTIIYSMQAAFPAASCYASQIIYKPVFGSDAPSEEELQKLNDNEVYFDELAELINLYNPTVKSAKDGVNTTEERYKEVKNSLSWEYMDSEAEKKEADDEGDMSAYTYYKTREAIYKSGIESYNKMIDSVRRNYSSTDIKKLGNQMTNAAVSLFLSYQSIECTKDTLEKTKELYEEKYKNMLVKEKEGLCSKSETAEIRNLLTGAENSLSELDNSMKEIYDSFSVLIGKDSGFTIMPLEISEEMISEEIDLSADISKAISNNYTMIETRHENTAGQGEIDKKRHSEKDNEANIKIGMDELYSAVSEARLEYEGALKEYESGEIKKKNSDLKKSMGMLSEEEYLTEELEFLNAETSLKTAELSLFSAYVDYYSGVNGILEF